MVPPSWSWSPLRPTGTPADRPASPHTAPAGSCGPPSPRWLASGCNLCRSSPFGEAGSRNKPCQPGLSESGQDEQSCCPCRPDCRCALGRERRRPASVRMRSGSTRTSMGNGAGSCSRARRANSARAAFSSDTGLRPRPVPQQSIHKLVHGAASRINRRVHVRPRRPVDACERDAPERRRRSLAGQRTIGVGGVVPGRDVLDRAAVRPAVDSDRLDVARRVEAAVLQSAREQVADVPLEVVVGRLREILAANPRSLARQEAAPTEHAVHVDEARVVEVRRVLVATHAAQ